MKSEVPTELERLRVTHGPMKSDESYGFNGAFILPRHMLGHKKKSKGERRYGPDLRYATLIVSDGSDWPMPGEPWEHASVGMEWQKRTPTWEEMHAIKRLLWDDDETVIQMHPPESEYVNEHPYCLHLWKPPYPVPTPPRQTLA